MNLNDFLKATIDREIDQEFLKGFKSKDEPKKEESECPSIRIKRKYENT